MGSIGSRIAELRTKIGMSQTDLGLAIGETKQTVYKYEHGIVTNIPLPKIEAIAHVLGCSPNYLTGWEKAEPKEPEEETVQAGTVLSAGEAELVDCYRSLNPDGQTAALAAVRGLTCLPEYRQDSPRASAS